MGSGAVVRIEVILRADCPAEGEVFGRWARRAGLDPETMSNEGCGCCVDIYTLNVPAGAASELDRLLGEVDNGVTYLPQQS